MLVIMVVLGKPIFSEVVLGVKSLRTTVLDPSWNQLVSKLLLFGRSLRQEISAPHNCKVHNTYDMKSMTIYKDKYKYNKLICGKIMFFIYFKPLLSILVLNELDLL